MLIRPATPNDVDALARIHQACFPRGWSAEEFSHFLSRPDIYSTFAAQRSSQDGTSLSAFILLSMAGGEAEIVSLCVEPSQRGRGFGKKILSHAVERLRAGKTSHVFLEVSEKNRAAIGLYTSFGFEMNGVRPDYAKEADGTTSDAHMMKYILNS